MRKPGTVSQGKASVIWRASHSAVGLVVTPIHRRRRRPSPKMTNTNSRSNASVGTMRKSTDAIPSAWLRRKVGRRTSPSQHVFRNRRLGDIKAELEQLAVNPRRAPKRIFLAHTAHEISGFLINPGPAAWIVRFPAPPGAKTHPVPANDCLRTHDRRGVADIGETPIQPDEQRPITAGKPQPFRSLSVQNVQLMAKDEDFSFQSLMRTKAVPHISEQKSEEGRHQFRS